MKIQPAVREQTGKVAAGVLILTALMVAVFLILGKFDWTVLTGAALGAAAGIANFFLMALTVQKAVDEMKPLPPEPEDESRSDPAKSEDSEPPLSEGAKRGRDRVRLSYTLRMLGIGAVAVLGAVLPWFNIYAVLIPLLFPGLVIRVIGAAENR